MKNRAKVFVIGGGIADCSALYHLTCEGWNDVVVVERNELTSGELTSGTTWHLVARVPNFGMLYLDTALMFIPPGALGQAVPRRRVPMQADEMEPVRILARYVVALPRRPPINALRRA